MGDRTGETLIETGDGHVIAVNIADGRVRVDWLGPRRANLTLEETRTLAYTLRGYAGMANPTAEPGS